jgi:hypothetical protein
MEDCPYVDFLDSETLYGSYYASLQHSNSGFLEGIIREGELLEKSLNESGFLTRIVGFVGWLSGASVGTDDPKYLAARTILQERGEL